MKAEDCVIMIKIVFLPYLPYLSRKAQFSFLTNQITKFEIVFTKNISISVGLLTDHTNCPFFFFCTGSVSWLSNHVSRCLCPAHPQTYRNTERTGRVGTGRAERIALLVHTSTRRSLQAVEPQILDSSPSLASDEFGNVKRAKPKNFSFVHCINEVCNVELSAHSSQISESLYQ